MYNNSMIVKTNSVSKTCVGCIYWIPETVANNGFNACCTNCSRAYTDQYTPTTATTSTYIASTGLGEDDDK